MGLLRATLPVGTLSGAPKIRALEIIDELEPVKRGVFGGAVGYLSWNGNMDAAIAIRTAVIKDQTLYIEAGAGIVADSIPELEWEETMNKARSIFRAVAMAEFGLGIEGEQGGNENKGNRVTTENRVQGVVKGTGDGMLRMIFVSHSALLGKGDWVVTSGLDGKFPKGLLFGKVRKADQPRFGSQLASGSQRDILLWPQAKIEQLEVLQVFVPEDDLE